MNETDKTKEPLVLQGLFFARKPSCLDDAIRAEQEYERTDIAVVEKVVVLSHNDFVKLRDDLNSDRVFIADNLGDMGMDEDKRWHCLLVIGAGETDGILVQSEGFTYPRYVARLEDADLIDKSQVPHIPGRLDEPIPAKHNSGMER